MGQDSALLTQKCVDSIFLNFRMLKLVSWLSKSVYFYVFNNLPWKILNTVVTIILIYLSAYVIFIKA